MSEAMQLLAPQDVAALLRLPSAREVRRMARRGQIPGVVRIGRRLRFLAAAVRQWLEQQAASSAPKPA